MEETINLFQGELPNVAIYDLVIQERENDLVIGTHGRSVYIIELEEIQKLAQPDQKVMQ